MKKIALSAIILAAITTTSAFAAEKEVKISGKMDVKALGLSQDLPEGKGNITANSKGMALDSSVNVTVEFKATTDEGIKYGATIGVQPLASKNRSNPSFIFVESDMGKLEFGSSRGAMSNMAISGDSVAVGMGCWSMYSKMDPNDYGLGYWDSFDSHLDDGTRNKGIVEFSRRITYYSPEFNGFQIGVTYVPDSSNSGVAGLSKPEKHTRDLGIEKLYMVHAFKAKNPGKDYDPAVDGHNVNTDVKDAFAFGVSYKKEINSETKVQLAVVGEIGKALNLDKDGKKIEDDNKKLKNLTLMSFGAKIEYKTLSFAGSYGDSFGSFTSKEQDGDNTKSNFWDIGVGYKFNKISSSLTYLSSSNRKQELQAVNFGTEYQLSDGLTPYLSLVRYTTNGQYKTANADGTNPEQKNDKQTGWIFAFGVRMKF